MLLLKRPRTMTFYQQTALAGDSANHHPMTSLWLCSLSCPSESSRIKNTRHSLYFELSLMAQPLGSVVYCPKLIHYFILEFIWWLPPDLITPRHTWCYSSPLHSLAKGLFPLSSPSLPPGTWKSCLSIFTLLLASDVFVYPLKELGNLPLYLIPLTSHVDTKLSRSLWDPRKINH